ncbi:HEPN domain-containing protein [Thermogladius sp. 4427co]|uniref:HEPN domain-containing protein n=1 Tax=Thermogladius sp. 4427co TaxID=3450718 RepID=UPI003F790D90
MSLFERFARKYFEEAVKDLGRAERAFNIGDYPQAVFYAQQCVEKAVKAMLESRKRVVYNHGPELIGIFVEVFEGEWVSDYNTIVEALEFLTEYYTRSRYPFVFKGNVLGPEDVIDMGVAAKGIELARKALGVVKDYLRRRGVI